ncbi:MAG: methyltransferase domain-containing protein [Gammaproteobacteria bacterium]|nr:methyltransferase domain-containing protein [Gammaproteobacteria bacterium]
MDEIDTGSHEDPLRAAQRRHAQAQRLQDLFHQDLGYAPGSQVLEPGCGTGEQTRILLQRNPAARVLALDPARASLEHARDLVRAEGLDDVAFVRGDIMRLPLGEATVDHVFAAHLLEHLPDPIGALIELARSLKPDGSITMIEGDHSSCYFRPASEAARECWAAFMHARTTAGGDPRLGAHLGRLVRQAGLQPVETSPLMLYIDPRQTELMRGFVEDTIVPLVEEVREHVVSEGVIDPGVWDRGVGDLAAVADRPDGFFCYTFFRTIATKIASDA